MRANTHLHTSVSCTMELRQCKSSDFLDRPFVKSHSSYCEAKGPIVKEGFVAARIRAIQGAYNSTSVSSWSHSPMVPCLTYQRLEKQESYPLSKTQTPTNDLRRPSFQSAGILAASVIRPFPEVNSELAPLNETGHFSSGGGRIGVDPQRTKSEMDAYASNSEQFNNPKSEEQVEQASARGSSDDMKKQTQEDTFVCIPLPLARQELTIQGGHLVQLEGAALDMGHNSILGRNGDEENLPTQPPEATLAEELGNTLDHASQGHDATNEGYNTNQTSSLNLSDPDGERKGLQGQDPYLKSSPTSDLSLRLFIKKSLASLLPTKNEESTSFEEIPLNKEHPVRRKIKEQVIHGGRTEDSLIVEPRDTGHFPLHSLASPKHTQRAFIPQPSTRAPSDTPEPIELRSLSTKPVTSHSHHQDESVLPIQNYANQFSDRAKPQDSITPIKSPRRSISYSPSLLHQVFSGAPEKPPSVLSGILSPQARRNWSWWRLLPADTQSDGGEILGKGPKRSVSDKAKPIDTLPLPKGSDVEYFQTRPAREAGTTPAISEPKHDDNHEIGLTTPGDAMPKANKWRTPNHIQPPSEPRAFLSSPSAESSPSSPRHPKPQHPQHHSFDWVANVPAEPLLQRSSGDASPVRLQATSSNGSSQRGGNRGQKIKRVQVIVTLDGSSDVMIEASMKRLKLS